MTYDIICDKLTAFSDRHQGAVGLTGPKGEQVGLNYPSV